MVKNGNFTLLLLELILADEVADLLADLTPQYLLLVVKNGDLTFLLLDLILADEVADLLADLPPPVVATGGQEWWFYISTVRAHIGRWSGRSTHYYWLLVVKNGNFTLLLTSTGCYWHLVVKNDNFTLLLMSSHQEWQYHIATDISWSRMAISRSTHQMHHQSVSIAQSCHM